MSKYSVIKSRAVLVVFFTVLSIISGLASCGGAKLSTSSDQYSSPDIYVSASPTLIAYGATSTITWTSLAGDCTSAPIGITGASGTFTTPTLTKTTTYTITCGSEFKKVTIALAPASLVSTITAQQTSCINDATVRTATYYYCDCGKGSAANCDASNADDTNDGTLNHPRKTLANAISTLAKLSGTSSFRFCKGGAFDTVASVNMPNTSCAPGGTCTDFREYASPVFTSAAKPILNSAPGGISLICITGSKGGIRLLNLKLHGNGASGNVGIFLYSGAHDVYACNLDIDGFRLGAQQVPGITSGATTIQEVTNVTLTGNNFTGNVAAAYLGSGFTTTISKNTFLNNGSGQSLDHTIYLSAAYFVTPNLMVSNNYLFGQIGDTCLGNMFGAHGKLPGLKIQNNVLYMDEAADTMGCYGIALDHGGYNSYMDFSSAVISGNTLSNTGGIGIAVSNCADCLIEDNVLSFNAAENYGIAAGVYAARTTCPNGTACPDVVNDRNTIRNNTIWFGPNAINGMTAGILIAHEGTGHIVANNTVNYTATTSTGHVVNCFDYTQPIDTAYSFINNNHCYSAVAYKWDKTNGATLADWKSYSITYGKGFSADSASKEGLPNFVNSTTSPYDFHPTGLPLLGTGSASSVPATDIEGTPFLNPPAIGAYQ